VAYYRDATASEVLVLGTAPRNLVAQLRLSFRTADDRELDVDQDADGMTDGVFIDVPQEATNERFFRQFVNSPGFRETVPRVAVAAIGSDGDITDAVAADLSDAPARKLGEVCDPYGFDRCPSAAVCSPGVPNTVNRCRAVDEQRSSLCEAAPRIRLDGPTVEVQSITGASTWRWYEGCVAAELGQRPDTALRLELEAPVSELVLESLNGAASDTDAVLSLYRDCGLEETDALGCNDDRSEESPEALLVLKNVPKGRYLVVVDAFRGTGPVQVRAYSR
jgi:hypothetical protein